MRVDRRKLIIAITGAVAIVLALFVIIKLVGIFTSNKEETKEGLAIIKEQESLNVEEVESKIQKLEDKEKEEEKATAHRTEKQMFKGSVVMGDSITQALEVYDILDASSVVAKIGVSITAIDDYIAKVEEMKPDTIFLAYGNNDVPNTNGDTALFKKEYAALLDELSKKLPDSRIFVNSIFPVQQAEIDKEPLYAHIPEYNEVLSELCDEKQITFIDNTSLVEDKYYEPDSIHFSAEFYPIWVAHMAEVADL